MQRPKSPPPTDEEILAYRNVPIKLAARYVGCGTMAIQYALQQGRVPFGFAAKGEKVWYYNISARALVRYGCGELPTYGLKQMLEIVTNEVVQILNAKLQAAKQSMDAA